MKNLFFLFFLFFFINSNSYAENICASTLSTANTGTIYDSGGLTGRYEDDEDCGFLIQPAGSAASISITFSQFEVENNYDFLYVYDGTNASAPLIGTFTGTSSYPLV
jgi:MSHA biogenesis protein MshQ